MAFYCTVYLVIKSGFKEASSNRHSVPMGFLLQTQGTYKFIRFSSTKGPVRVLVRLRFMRGRGVFWEQDPVETLRTCSRKMTPGSAVTSR